MIARLTFAGGISAYQKFISPRKGFCCAHRTVHGGPSCSEFARRAVLRYGIFKALVLLRYRFGRCRDAYLMHSEQQGRWPNDESPKVCAKELPSVCVGCCPWP